MYIFIPFLARGRTNLELREKFILPEGASQGMTPFRSRGRRSKPSSRAASPTRSSSSASQSNHSCTSMPSSPATPASGTKVCTDAPRGLLPHCHRGRCLMFILWKTPGKRRAMETYYPDPPPTRQRMPRQYRDTQPKMTTKNIS